MAVCSIYRGAAHLRVAGGGFGGGIIVDIYVVAEEAVVYGGPSRVD